MAAEAACAFSAVTPTESLLPPEKIPLIVLAPAEILLISITGRMTGVVSMSSDSTIERFASVFLVESKASPCYAFRCPANDMRIPFQTIYKTHIHGYGNHYSKKSGEFMFLRWICRALRDRQNQSQGLDFAINFADGKVILHRACFLNTLTVCLLCQHPAPSPTREAALLLFSPFFNLRSCKYPLHSFLHLAIMKELLLKPEWLFLRPR